MKNIEFLYDISTYYNLGEVSLQPTKVNGGLTHKMYKLETSKGKYAVKILNPEIMKRSKALFNFHSADKLESILEKNKINAIYSLTINDSKLQKYNNTYFYIYYWYDGVLLKDDDITVNHCKLIGKELATIHNIEIKNEKNVLIKKEIDWNYYIEKCKKENIELYNLLYNKVDILNESIICGNKAIKSIPNVVTLCHNDMDIKNVMWNNLEYKLIDLECLNYSNPYLELFELALCWSGYEKCDIDFDLLETFINSYFSNTKLNIDINWEVIYYANNGRLDWLEYNLKRALLIECNDEEEQKLGVNEVKKTINQISYYYKIKYDILKKFSC